MKNKRSILVFLFIVFLPLTLNACAKESATAASIGGADIYKTISTGGMQMGDVLIELTPIGMQNGKFAVNFAANTHSVDLSQFDLMQIATLEYDGISAAPISAPRLSGHHNSGILVFDAGKELKSFKIIIRNIPNVQERIFEWG